MPAAAAVIFLVVPNLQGNALTAADVFRVYPALMILIVAAAAVGLILTGCRVRALRLSSGS